MECHKGFLNTVDFCPASWMAGGISVNFQLARQALTQKMSEMRKSRQDFGGAGGPNQVLVSQGCINMPGFRRI